MELGDHKKVHSHAQYTFQLHGLTGGRFFSVLTTTSTKPLSWADSQHQSMATTSPARGSSGSTNLCEKEQTFDMHNSSIALSNLETSHALKHGVKLLLLRPIGQPNGPAQRPFHDPPCIGRSAAKPSHLRRVQRCRVSGLRWRRSSSASVLG